MFQPTKMISDPRWWTASVAAAVQLVFFLRWLYRRIRNEELMRAFVKDLATHHLPHIYELLEKICDQRGIGSRKAPPHIRWVDLGRRQR